MEELNNKTTGGIAPFKDLASGDWNQLSSEVQNVITALGIVLSNGDLNQLGKAIAGYVANGDFYTDGGAVNAAVLSVIGSKQGPTIYTNGMRIRFHPVADNTSVTVNVNVNGLGNKLLKYSNGNPLSVGEITTGKAVDAYYNSGSGHFRLINQKGSAVREGELQLSDSNTSTSTDLAATIGQVTKRARVASNEDITGGWTWQDNIRQNFGTALDTQVWYRSSDDSFVTDLSSTADWVLQDDTVEALRYDNSTGEFIFAKPATFKRTSTTFPVQALTNFAITDTTFQPMVWFRDAALDVEGLIQTNSISTQYLSPSDPRMKSEFEIPTPVELWEDFDKLHSCYGKYYWEKAPDIGSVYGFNAHKLIDAGFTDIASEGQGSRELGIGDIYDKLKMPDKDIFDKEGKKTGVKEGEEIDLKVTAATMDNAKVIPYLFGVIDDLRKRVIELENN